MGLYNGSVITNAGAAMIASAIAGGKTVEFTAVKTSSHVYSSGTNLAELTSISNIVQSISPSSVQVYNETTVQVVARFSNANVVNTYSVNTLGVYAKYTGGSETLLAVITAVTPDVVESGTGTSLAAYVYNVQMVISNAPQVTLTVNDAGTATTADLNRIAQEKVQAIGGDLSQTIINSATSSSASFPALNIGDTMQVMLGKLIKLRADIVSGLDDKATKNNLQSLDTPVSIVIQPTDWQSSGSNYTCTKSCAKASTDNACRVEFIPANPASMTAANLRILRKNLSYLYPRPVLGNGSVTFYASQAPTIALTFAAVGGLVS